MAFALRMALAASLACGAQAANLAANPSSRGLAECGYIYAPPIARPGPAVQPRTCPAPSARAYKPKFQTIGHEVLTEESHACFVPDSAFELLDSLIERGREKYSPLPIGTNNWEAAATPFFKSMGQVLLDAGFQLYIPTETLGDALVNRQLDAGGQRIADCDTGSLLYMSTAEVLGLPVSMVEIKLRSGSGHNYLRWSTSAGQSMDWDTNGRAQCTTPSGQPAWQGRTMSRVEVLGYTRGLRGLLQQKRGRNQEAAVDYRDAAKMYPQSPWAPNNLAWLLATRAEFDKPAEAGEAVDNALRAVSIERDANNLDTLACAHARKGDFTSALAVARDVVALAPGNEAFKQRLKNFEASPPKNCVGLD
ncbi:MAG: hypothetical protein K2W93_10160 [Burkholderiaceae bacterium]|nr:hypothetical protein [Burkholderiaceae bacterium]